MLFHNCFHLPFFSYCLLFELIPPQKLKVQLLKISGFFPSFDITPIFSIIISSRLEMDLVVSSSLMLGTAAADTTRSTLMRSVSLFSSASSSSWSFSGLTVLRYSTSSFSFWLGVVHLNSFLSSLFFSLHQSRLDFFFLFVIWLYRSLFYVCLTSLNGIF